MNREDIYEGKQKPWPKTGTPKFIDWAEEWPPATETKPEENVRRKIHNIVGPQRVNFV